MSPQVGQRGAKRLRGKRRVAAVAAGLMAATLPALATAAPPQFGSSGPISIPGDGAATPYPWTIDMPRLSGVVTDVNVTLEGLSHPSPGDLDLFLVGPTGMETKIMSDVGRDFPVAGLTFTLDDEAKAVFTVNSALTSGRFRTINIGAGDVFPAPAPTPSGRYRLFWFDGLNPHGPWSLFVVDDSASGGSGSINGWRLELTVAAPSVANARVKEGRSVTFVVRLASAPTFKADPIVLRFRTVRGTAKTRKDFTRTSGTVAFYPGQSMKTVSVETRDDGRNERTERFFLKVTDPTGNSVRGRGRITDND